MDYQKRLATLGEKRKSNIVAILAINSTVKGLIILFL